MYCNRAKHLLCPIYQEYAAEKLLELQYVSIGTCDRAVKIQFDMIILGTKCIIPYAGAKGKSVCTFTFRSINTDSLAYQCER